MKEIKVVILGTSSQFPTKRRNHISVFLRYDRFKFLFDCGEGTQRQMRSIKLSPFNIDAIFISHWHGDHTLGIGGILQSLSASNRTRPLLIFGPEGTKRSVACIMKAYLFKKTFRYEVREISVDKEEKIFESNEFYITAFPLEHNVPCLGYNFCTKPARKIDVDYVKKFGLANDPLLGRLKEGKDIVYKGKKIEAEKATYWEEGKKVCYMIDTRFNENLIKYASKSDLLICESTFASEDEDKCRDYFHMTAKQSAAIAKKSRSKELVLVHLSQRYSSSKPIENEAKKVFKNSKVADDFDEFTLK